ncbi:MAG: acetate/propionate family kinase [Rhodopila sp.]
MEDTILVINAGSSSIKFAVWPAGETDSAALLQGEIARIDHVPQFTARNAAGQTLTDWKPAGGGHEALLRGLVDWIDVHTARSRLMAAGHRVVHGGTRFSMPVVIDDLVMHDLEALTPLAPLHQPHNLAPIRALAAVHPHLPQVACFDTAFHRGHADVATRFALPREFHDAGVRRYGFHGLSYEYITRVLVRKAPQLAAGRVVIAHLGSGASLCAVHDGSSIDSTMGFTAVDGLPMGTRCGSIDPGVVLFLMARGMGHEALQHLLYDQSGLLGVSGGISNDMQDLLASDRPEAAQAVDLFVYRVVREIAALAASMGGIDGIVFTGGIGEHAVSIRERICLGCAWLGVELDPAANAGGAGRISNRVSHPAAWVIPTDESQMIAIHTVEALRAAASRTESSPRELLDA